MSNSTKSLILLPVVCGVSMAVQAQNLFVRQHNGTQNTYDISNVKSIKFAPGNVYIHQSAGIDNYALSAIRYLNFTDLIVGINDKNEANSLAFTLFPNPANNQLNISFLHNINENGVVTVYTIDGKIAFKQLIHRAQKAFQFNISHLNTGVYFCAIQIGNQSNTQKFIKH